jgi:hypothetical protein
MNDKENTTIRGQKKMPRYKLAGETYESSPDECFTKKHDEEGFCRGNGHGEGCGNGGDADCDVDLYCDVKKRTCESAGLFDHSCYYDEKCASYLTCSWNDGVMFKCKPYGFYEVGTMVGPGEEDDACKSNYINSTYYCDTGPKLIGEIERNSPGEKCTYSHGEYDYSKCYYHAGGKAICKQGMGPLEPDWKIVVEYLHKHPKCHVSIPLAQCDMGRKVVSSDEEWAKVWMAISRVHWDAHFQGMPKCLKQYIHPESFKFEKKEPDFAALPTISLVVGAVVGLVLLL